MDIKALQKLSYGVYVVSTWDKGRATGCIANSAMQITAEPATVAVSINKDNYTHRCICDTGKFSISVLSEKADPTIIGNFGFSSGRDKDKYGAEDYELKDYTPVSASSAAYIVCELVDKLDAGTHTVFLGRVTDCGLLADSENEPMTYAYYHKVVKGKSPKNAPTYVAEEEPRTDGGKWVCSVCLHEYDGDVPFEELPEDWVCPICKQPKSVFRKQ